jgi:formylmethanofuran dehydrogenase subunit E
MLAYRELPDAELFSEQWVRVPIHPREMPGYKSARIACAICGEGINYDRNTTNAVGEILCQSCAASEDRYYQPL